MMGLAIAVTRLDWSAAELRREASRCDDGRAACRMLAIAHVLDGASRTDAARLCGMDRQTLRDWVHRYNVHGIEGLTDAPRTGRPPSLSKEQAGEIRAMVLAGPDLARDGVVRWRCADLQKVIEKRFAVGLHERTVGKLLRRLGLSRVQPRPHNPKRDVEAQETFKKTFPIWPRRPCPPRQPASRLRFGSAMKPGSASRAH
jgi:transposase